MQIERRHQWKAHSGALYAMAIGRDDRSLFSAGADRVVAEWTLGNDNPNTFAIRLESTIYSLLHLKNNHLVIGTAKGGMHVVDLKAQRELRHLKFHDKGIFYLHPSQDHNLVYAASADGSMSVWNAADWSLLWHLPLTHAKVRRIASSPDGENIAVALGDGRCALIETKSHKLTNIIEAHEGGCNSLAFIDEHTLLTGGKDAHLKLWDLRAGGLLIKSIPAHNYAIYDIIVHPKHLWIATASRDKTVKVWKPDLSSTPIRLDRAKSGGHINSVNALFYEPSTDVLYSCSDDRSICAWKIKLE
jgi:WD40 repeat protein